MKVAISSNNGKMDSAFSPRFGRCKYFVIIDTPSNAWEAVPNGASSARGGAGTQVVQLLADKGVEAVITGRCGPNAFSALMAAGIKIYQGQSGTPQELVEKLVAGELSNITGASAGGRF